MAASHTTRSQPYRIGWPASIKISPELQKALGQQFANIDECLQLVFSLLRQDASTIGSGGSGSVITGAGAPGVDGLDGDDGLPGPPGLAGVAGIPGSSGIAAIDGADGDDAFPIPGPQGPTGAAGATGATGPSGSILFADDGQDGDIFPPMPGPQGAQGAQGLTGSGGPVGPVFFIEDGLDGESGFPGTPGAAGASGSTTLAIAQPGGSQRKPYWMYYDDQATTTANTFGTLSSTAGTASSVIDSVTSRRRLTTASGDGSSAGSGMGYTGGAGTFYHLPYFVADIVTGSLITTEQLWVGLFNNATRTSNPGTDHNGVNVAAHAAFRFATAVDGTTWHLSVADGTTQATADSTIAIAASTRYKLAITFTSNLIATFSINGVACGSLTLNTNAGDASPLAWGVWVFNNGTGFTRFIDIAAVYGDYN